jgi:carbonic anhydrase/acetyltransferase-like protein (isoleucine patch superfamily)
MSVFSLAPNDTKIDETAWVAPSATVIGHVTLSRQSSVWFNAVIRGDNERIELGEGSNVQEGAVLHTDIGYPLHIGRNVSIGINAMLHGCQIEDGAKIGTNAIVMNGAVIGKNSIVAEGSVVTEGKIFPDDVLILGCPAKVIRQLDSKEILANASHSNQCNDLAQRYKISLKDIG